MFTGTSLGRLRHKPCSICLSSVSQRWTPDQYTFMGAYRLDERKKQTLLINRATIKKCLGQLVAEKLLVQHHLNCGSLQVFRTSTGLPRMLYARLKLHLDAH